MQISRAMAARAMAEKDKAAALRFVEQVTTIRRTINAYVTTIHQFATVLGSV